jgi:hypothetical protein
VFVEKAPHTLSETVQFNFVKKLHEKLNWMFSGTAQVSHQVCQFFFLSVLRVFLCVWLWWIKTRLSASKLRKLGDSLSELRSYLCERRLGKQFWGLRYCLSKLRSLLSFFPSGMTTHIKIAQFNWECRGRLRLAVGWRHLADSAVCLVDCGNLVWGIAFCVGYKRNIIRYTQRLLFVSTSVFRLEFKDNVILITSVPLAARSKGRYTLVTLPSTVTP